MRSFRWVLVVWLFLWSSQAGASSIKPYIQQAASLYRKGRKQSQKGQHVQAVEFYKEAMRWVRKAFPLAKKSPTQMQKLKRSEGTFLYIVARSYLDGKRCRLAHYYARKALRSPIPVRTQALAAKCRQQALQLPHCRPGALVLQSTPGKARYAVAGSKGWLRGIERGGEVPVRRPLLPGAWSLRVQKTGFLPQTIKVLVKPGQTTTLRLVLKPVPMRAPTQPSHAKTPKWIVLGASVAAVVAGTALLAWGGSTYAGVAAQQGSPIPGVNEVDTFAQLKAQTDTGTIGVGLGGGLLGVGLIGGGFAAWWLFQSPKPPPTAAVISPTPLTLHRYAR